MRCSVLAIRSLLLMLGMSAPAMASNYEPEHGKVNTGDGTPVGANVVEVEVGYSPSRVVQEGWQSFDDSRQAYEHMFELSATWGPTDNLDFGAATGYGFLHEQGDQAGPGPREGHGHTDGSLGARYRFLSLDQLDLAATTGVTLPTGQDAAPERLGLSQVCYSWDSTLVASADSGRATGNLEFGFTLPIGSAREQERGTGVANLAVGYHVLDWLQPEAELNFQHAFVAGPDADLLAVTFGVVAPWGNGHRATAGVQQAVWGHDTPAFTAGSVTYKAAF